MKTNFFKKWLAIVFISFAMSALFAALDVFGSFLVGFVIFAISNISIGDNPKINRTITILERLSWLIFSVGGLFFAQMIFLQEFEIILYIPFVIVYLGSWMVYSKKQKKQKILKKEDIQTFDLWLKYYEFLESVKIRFGKELETKTGEAINSFIESRFFDENGNKKEDSPTDHPEYVVIYFKSGNRKNFVDLCFNDGETKEVCVSFWDKEDDPDAIHHHVCSTKRLFSSDIIKSIASWIKTGEFAGIVD